MKTILLAALVAGGALIMSGCADEGYYHHGPMAVGYAGYYDDAYGPFNDGYWADDGFFYYSTGGDRHYRRDDAHHFRRDGGTGFHPVQGHPRDGGQGGGHGRDHDGDRR